MCPKQQHELMLAYKHALKQHHLQQCVTQSELLNVTQSLSDLSVSRDSQNNSFLSATLEEQSFHQTTQVDQLLMQLQDQELQLQLQTTKLGELEAQVLNLQSQEQTQQKRI